MGLKGEMGFKVTADNREALLRWNSFGFWGSFFSVRESLAFALLRVFDLFLSSSRCFFLRSLRCIYYIHTHIHEVLYVLDFNFPTLFGFFHTFSSSSIWQTEKTTRSHWFWARWSSIYTYNFWVWSSLFIKSKGEEKEYVLRVSL